MAPQPALLGVPGLSSLVRGEENRASFELTEEELKTVQLRFHAGAGGGLGQFQQQRSSLAGGLAEDPDFRRWKTQHPSILEDFAKFEELAEGKRVAIFLDYDGTLTPIVKNPERAYMSDQMRQIVRQLSQLFPTAIVSGRGREKVQTFVKLKELYYAGSHGMDIAGPQEEGMDTHVLAFQPAARFGPIMDRVHDSLVERVADIPGASVEHNIFCVSVHFRNCEESSWEDVQVISGAQAAVDSTLAEHSELKLTRGRKVLELRPQVEWDKGCALAHLLEALGLDAAPDVLPIYIGDDRTDEDAFRLLAQRATGCGILVSTRMKPTDACYTLQDPSEVMAFLDRLVRWGGTHSNVWHAKKACLGWKLRGSCIEGLHTQPSVAGSPPANLLTGASVACADTLASNSARSPAGQACAAQADSGELQHSAFTSAEASAVGGRPRCAPLATVTTTPLRKSLEERRSSLEFVTGSGAGSSGLPGGSPMSSSPAKNASFALAPQAQAASAMLAFKSFAGGSRAGPSDR